MSTRDDKEPKEGAPKGGAPKEGALSDSQVAAYLRDHPDFLLRHSDLIDTLVPPENRVEGAAGGIVLDLQRFMLGRMREELRELRGSQGQLISAGRANMAAQSRVHEAVLALLTAPSFERLIETVTDDLSILLDLDVATLCVERREVSETDLTGEAGISVRGLHRLDPGEIERAMQSARRIELSSAIQGDPVIFGPMAGLVRSQAYIRLQISTATPPALLALGARDPDAFHPGQGTELLDFLGRSLELTLRAWLDLPE